MRLGKTPLAALLMFATMTFTPLAEAAPVVACVDPAPAVGGAAAPGPYWQVAVLTLLTPTGICGGVAEATGAAAVCPPAPFVGAVPGAFCGAAVPFGGAATCTWFAGASLFGFVPNVIVGFDLDGDGQLTRIDVTFDGIMAQTPFGLGADTFTNLNGFGAGGRLIAYPSGFFVPEVTVPVWISCV